MIYGGYVTYAVIPSVLGGLICGLALGNVALVIVDKSFDEIMNNDFDLEAFSSMLCWGGLVGACVGSVCLNNIAGRRFAIAFSAFLSTFGSLGSVCAQDAFGLLSSRFLQGISLGILSHSVPIYVAEISPSNLRGIGVGVFEFSVSLGVLLVYSLSLWLLSSTSSSDLLSQKEKWQLLLFIPGVPSILLLFQYTAGYLPASPRLLLLRNRSAEARDVLLRVLPCSSQEVAAAQVEKEMKIIRKAILFERRQQREVQTNNANMICAVGLMLFQVLVGIDLFTVYFFYICRRAAMPLSDSGNLLVLTGVTHILVGLLVLPLIDRVGRRTLLRVGSWIMCVAMIGLSMMITSKPSISHPFVFSIFILLFCGAFSSTWGPIAVRVVCFLYPSKSIVLYFAHSYNTGTCLDRVTTTLCSIFWYEHCSRCEFFRWCRCYGNVHLVGKSARTTRCCLGVRCDMCTV